MAAASLPSTDSHFLQKCTETRQSPSIMTPTISPTIPPTLSSSSPISQKTIHRITLHPTLTPHRRRVYLTLLTVPAGRWTTYSALAKHLGSSARAIGNAMRTNPFAPEVPCHRVLAADGSLGGYKGEWRVSKEKLGNGSFVQEKRLRLEGEGVRFDQSGKARGIAFVKFGDLEDVKKGK